MLKNCKKKIILAVGGTGGHLFPAQALAQALLEKEPIDILFAGANLKNNRFLDKTLFRFKEVISATPFRRNPLLACFILLKGIKESFTLLKLEKPDLVIGFGSYHSFPLLVAAKLQCIPFVLFEADTIPGKVNRLFSRYALFTAIHFPHSGRFLKGRLVPVAMPSRHRVDFDALPQEQARQFLGLDPLTFTLFVFGGSQGAKGINHQIPALLSLMKEARFSVQLIHITGKEETSSAIKDLCGKMGIACYVKEFESQIGYLWKAATLVIGRSGASTLFEMIDFEVPGIVIPYPHASDAHQHINAQFLEYHVNGGMCLLEQKATPVKLFDLICTCEKKLHYFKRAMQEYKGSQKKENLEKVIYEFFASCNSSGLT